jgi:hypothetical protein
MASSAFAAVCETYKMTRRFIFVALCLATASAALVQPASAETPGPRPISRTEGRKILASIPTLDAESETDCSHLVHDVLRTSWLSIRLRQFARTWGSTCDETFGNDPYPSMHFACTQIVDLNAERCLKSSGTTEPGSQMVQEALPR